MRRAMFLVGTCIASTFMLGGVAGAVPTGGSTASPLKLPGIGVGTQWTFSTSGTPAGCTVITFYSKRPGRFDDDLGDSGKWSLRGKTVTLHFNLGSLPRPYGLAPGSFKGTYIPDPPDYYGMYRPRGVSKGAGYSSGLTPGADPDC